MPKKSYLEYIGIIFIALFIGIFSGISYVLHLLQTPANTMYLGITHYFSDYFVYLSQFMEGSSGAWLDHNLFTEELTTPVLLHWPNILLGYLGGLVHLSPITSYHISVVLINVAIVLTAYYAFCRVFPHPHIAFPATLFFVFSESYMNRLTPGQKYTHWPFELWNTPHFMSMRFGNAPHYLIQTLLFLFLIIFFFQKHRKQRPYMPFLLMCCTIGFTLMQPIIATLLIGIYGYTIVTTGRFTKSTDRNNLIVTIFGYSITAVYSYGLMHVPPYDTARIWEGAQQVLTTFPFLCASIGPILPLAIIGIITRFRKGTPIEWMGVLLLVIGYALFLSPIPKTLGLNNTRFLAPGFFIFFAWFAAVGTETIAHYMQKITLFSTKIAYTIITLIFLITVSPTIVWEIKNKLPEINILNNQGQYLPDTTYDAFRFLQTTGKKNNVVLASSQGRINLMVPAFSGHKTVVGTDQVTINYETKYQEALLFYQLQMDDIQAKQFLANHRVSYILLTDSDGDPALFQSHYTFLHLIFQTPTASIYIVESSPMAKPEK